MSFGYLEEINSTVVATVAGLVIGMVMKFATKIADRRKDSLTEHLELRKELREELDSVKEEIHQLQRELDEWREKYYNQLEVNAVLQSELAALRHELSEYKNGTAEHPTSFRMTDE
jgi:uncharacterized coiled-coil DUF342 family protein